MFRLTRFLQEHNHSVNISIYNRGLGTLPVIQTNSYILALHIYNIYISNVVYIQLEKAIFYNYQPYIFSPLLQTKSTVFKIYLLAEVSRPVSQLALDHNVGNCGGYSILIHTKSALLAM
jgi:hypothetical protein